MGKFLTIDEMHALCADFTRTHIGTTYDIVGQSRAGHAIYRLTISHMPESSLFLGFPHPNEPLMSLVLPSLLKMADTRRASHNTHFWGIIPLWDIDGVLLNHEWWTQIDGDISLEFLMQNYFRPAPRWQVEWTFPVKYRGYQFTDPLPETKAVMATIDQYKPEFLFSLHNTFFPEGYAFLDRRLQHQAPAVSALLAAHSGLRIQNPIPYAEEWAPSVYGLPHLAKEIDYYHEKNIPLALDYGGASFDYAAHAKGVIVEIPIVAAVKESLHLISLAEIQEKWTVFFEWLISAFGAGAPPAHLLPLLVSNPYYFRIRLPHDLPLIHRGLERLDTQQLNQRYLSDLFMMAANLAMVNRHYGTLNRPLDAILAELQSVVGTRLALIDIAETARTYVNIVAGILDGG